MDKDQFLSSYMQDFQEDENPELIPVHVSREEIEYFNYMQGGQFIDERTGLREYSKLSEVLRNPEVRDLFIDLSQMQKNGEPLPPELIEFTDEEDPMKEGSFFEPIPSDDEPLVEDMGIAGNMDHEGDTYVVMMPQDVSHFLDELQGEEDRDPKYGLPEYGLFGGLGRFLNFSTKLGTNPFNIKAIDKVVNSNPFRSLVRVGATVVGTYFGGPLGAALGNMAGRAVTGQKPGMDMLKAGGMNALYGYGAGALMNGLGMSAGALGANAGTGSSLMPGLSAGAKQTVAPVIDGSTGLAYKFGPLASKTVVPSVTQSSGLLSGASGMLGSASQYLLPGALLAGGAMLARRGEKQEMNEYNKIREEQNRKLRSNLDSMNQPLETQGYYPRSFINTSGGTPSMYKKGGKVQAYKKGGKIQSESYEGSDKGQDDTINRTRKEGDWIWTATDVAHLGDGNTKAGFKEIRKFENKIKKNMLHPSILKDPGLSHGGNPRKVPCALSDGEHSTDLHLVSALGDGSNEQGSKILRDIRKELRRHKISNGLGLPPKAHDLDFYYKKVTSKGK